MEVTKPVHLTLVIVATLVFVAYLFLDRSPRIEVGDAAFRALVWTTHTLRLAKALALYLAFSVVVLGHAICSQPSQSDVRQDAERDK